MGEDIELVNWWPGKTSDGVDPHEFPPWHANPVRIERRTADQELAPLAPVPEGLRVSVQQITGPPKRVKKGTRTVVKPQMLVDVLNVPVAGHVATIASLNIDQAMHLHFSADNWQQTRTADDTLHELVDQGGTLTVRLDYPFGGLEANTDAGRRKSLPRTVADVLIEPVYYARPDDRGTRRSLTVSSILWQIAQAYAQIYREEIEDVKAQRPVRWGIWGHSLRDLVFEGLAIDPHRGLANVSIGS